jgi:hypothetical protein
MGRPGASQDYGLNSGGGMWEELKAEEEKNPD